MDSKLQIISGTHRGRKLFLPPDARPTQNRARIALFNMMTGIVDSPAPVVWDAFAGSGAFGIEWISRIPNARVIFTDAAPQSIATVKKNLNLIGATPNATVDMADAIGRVGKYGGMADLIFIDPPYADAELGAAFVRRLTRVARSGTILVWESESGAPAPVPAGWEILRDKTYGRARFLILEHK